MLECWHVSGSRWPYDSRGQQEPDFVSRRNGRVHLNRPGEGGQASVQSIIGSRVVRITGINAGYTMFRGSVRWYWLTIRQFPLHFPSRASPCAIKFHQQSTTRQLHHCTISGPEGNANGLALRMQDALFRLRDPAWKPNPVFNSEWIVSITLISALFWIIRIV